MTKILQKISLVLTLSTVSILALQSLVTKAQYAPPSEYYKATLTITPDMTTAPLFKSMAPISIALTGYQSTIDINPALGAYTCTFEVRPMQERAASTTWTSLASSVPYSPTAGCSTSMTKAVRGNGLNWSFRVTVKSVSDSATTHAFFSEYAFSFQGAGVAVGS